MTFASFRLNTLSAAMAGASYISATGGTVNLYSTGGKTYQVHTFTSSGTFTVASGAGTVDVLLVGGGGSGGRTGNFGMGGGGGAGQVQYLTAVTAATSSITIGAGGPASVDNPLNGDPTSAFGYTSNGGGAGGVNSDGNNGRSVTGGSGGGGGGTYQQAGSGGTGAYNGGNARNSNEAGGGGGGAGGAGANSPSSGRGGSGGVGSAITDIFQSGTQTYGGGGGGGGSTSFSGGGTGGSSIGGAGATSSGSAVSGGNAVANTGSGGGGGYSNGVSGARNIGGAGSAGIVRIRYEVAPGTRLQTSYSGTIYTASSYFGSSGLGYSTGQSGTRTFTMPAARGANATTIEFYAYKGTESGQTPNSIFQFGEILLQNRLNTASTQWGIISSSSQTVISQTGNGTADAYQHICFQTTGNGTWTWWVNGYRTGTFSASVDTTDFTIGRLNQFSSGVFTIRFDEIRVSSVTRYNASTDLTVPTAPFVNDADTVGLFHCETTTQLDDNAI